MKLYLLRHCERGHGENQDTLTELGKGQAEKMVSYLGTLKIDKIICAETNRAKETINPFLVKSGFKNVEFTSLVNEQEMGELTGKLNSEYEKAREEAGLSKDEFKSKRGENYFDLIERARLFLEKLKKEKLEDILVVTHAGFIRSIAILLLNLKREELNFNSASITSIELDEKFNILNYKLNSMSHLR